MLHGARAEWNCSALDCTSLRRYATSQGPSEDMFDARWQPGPACAESVGRFATCAKDIYGRRRTADTPSSPKEVPVDNSSVSKARRRVSRCKSPGENALTSGRSTEGCSRAPASTEAALTTTDSSLQGDLADLYFSRLRGRG